MKKGQIVKILLENGKTIEESIRKISDKEFSTKNYTFKIGVKKYHPTQSGVLGCALLDKTTLTHKLTLGLL